ncbi:hypothetical protein ACIBEJ_00420 [Nonomuraea sp. NPDC050790]|uniref:hypothetical protein n=1 Tax=Nonomuraea sp. NPDC050790 TaxID=3364371 RepID=UPI00378BAF02
MAVNIDKVAFDLAHELLACFCEALNGTVAGAPCRCSLLPGANVAADLCCDCGRGNGQAWVRVDGMWPTTSRWPQRLLEAEACPLGMWAVQLELGAYRCAAKVDGRGRPPSAERLTRDTEIVLDDAAAMRLAASCCFRPAGGPTRRMIVGEWRPLGPEGGCVGGYLQVTVKADDCCP